MAQTIEALRSQIGSIEEMQSVVTTMKALAAVNIRQYEEAVAALAEYNHAIELGLQIALRHKPAEIKIAQRVLEAPLGAIVWGSDQGMVGQFNQEVAGQAHKVLDKSHFCERRCTLLAIGRRVTAQMAQSGRRPLDSLPVPSSLAGITPMVQDLLLRIETWREERQIEQVLLFYNTPTGGASYRPRVQQLLPVDLRWLRELESRPWRSRGLPTYNLNWDALFAALIREYFFVSLYRAFAASLASENASRLASMQAAEKNIDERLDTLRAQYHHLRQSSITEELMDIVAGYEVLTGAA
ncbi:MAG: F0F1 ATP synthase subunit gamma [Chloroflexota bacterium]